MSVRHFEKVGILGDFQTGKTTFAKHLLVLSGAPYIAWDPTWAYDSTMGVVVHDLRNAKWAWQMGQRRIVWQPPRGTDLPGTFEKACDWMLSLSNVVFFVDEPALALKPTHIPLSVGELWRLGHKRGIGVWWATHRYHGDIPALLRIVHHWFVFRISVDIDLDEIAGNIGREGAQWVRNAPDYHYWWKSKTYNGPGKPIDISKTGGVHAPTSQGQGPSPSTSERAGDIK